jgi:hypothetical protein
MTITLTKKQLDYSNSTFPERIVSSTQNEAPFEMLYTCELAAYLTATIIYEMGLDFGRMDERRHIKELLKIVNNEN